MADRNAKEVKFAGFPDGVNNVAREHELPAGEELNSRDEAIPPRAARELKNIDLMARGRAKRRRGYTLVQSVSDGRGLVSHMGDLYFADGGQLYAYRLPDGILEAVHPVAPQAEISTTDINGELFVTDGAGTAFKICQDGSIVDWAPEQPNGQPHLDPVNMGSLPAGEYQVAVTFLRGYEESGTARAARVNLSEQGAIQVDNIPQPSGGEITGVRLYVSRTSSEKLYQFRDLSVGTTEVLVSILPRGKELMTQFLEPVPAGHLVRSYQGRLYTAVGETLIYSAPLRFGLTNLSHSFIQFHGPIQMIRPVSSGVFVSAGLGSKKRTVFLAGRGPEDFESRTVYTHGAVPGTDTVVSAALFTQDALSAGEVAVWWATNGVMVMGLPGGEVRPVREGELALPTFSQGAILERERDGVRQLLSVLSTPQAENPLAVSDSISIEVHKNGINT